MNIFEKASRLKLRFDTPKGPATVENLWDLPLTSSVGAACLDSIAIALDKQLKETTVSFVETKSASTTLTQLKFDIVKHVIDTRLQEKKDEAKSKERSEKKAQIMELIAAKEGEELSSKSKDDLLKMLAALEA